MFGISWIFIYPPFHTPDEDAHILRAFMLSKGHILGAEEPGKLTSSPTTYTLGWERIGFTLPDCFERYFMLTGVRENRYNQESFDSGPFKIARQIQMRTNTNVWYEFANTLQYSPFAYPLTPFVLVFASLFNWSVAFTVFACRLAVFTVSAMGLYISYRLIPVLKLSLVMLLFVPVFIQQSFAPGPDFIVNAGSILYFALSIFPR